MFEVELHFCGDLPGFLPRALREMQPIRRLLSEKTAIKDVIESCGVPHTEVDLIVPMAGEQRHPRTVGFEFQVDAPIRLQIHPAPAPADLLPAVPRLQLREALRFIADGHLGKLARNLRLLGVDTAYERDADDRRLLELMVSEGRALLTRDRRLLMHSIVLQGYCPRSSDPEEQTREVVHRFDLLRHPDRLAPWSRCLRCNGRIEPASKADVLAPLQGEPLTLRYYNEFQRCTRCGRIYWPGTHFEKLKARLLRLSEGGV
jgi:uncharacterized protein with PIN domain